MINIDKICSNQSQVYEIYRYKSVFPMYGRTCYGKLLYSFLISHPRPCLVEIWLHFLLVLFFLLIFRHFRSASCFIFQVRSLDFVNGHQHIVNLLSLLHISSRLFRILFHFGGHFPQLLILHLQFP